MSDNRFMTVIPICSGPSKLMHLIYHQFGAYLPVRGSLRFFALLNRETSQPWCKPWGEWEQWRLQTSHTGLVLFDSCPPHICHFYTLLPWGCDLLRQCLTSLPSQGSNPVYGENDDHSANPSQCNIIIFIPRPWMESHISCQSWDMKNCLCIH